ncbi:MAG: GFA family protein [Alphaproteobacteria bacterium]|nr:GFA family protein [Alphaproteobacteria bacterium]
MKHSGGCHCGNVRFDVEMTIDTLMACNCSICSKRGYLLAFTPEKNFTLLSGADSLTDYQFGKKNIHHVFCKTCGVSAFRTGRSPIWASEFRCNKAKRCNSSPISTDASVANRKPSSAASV